MPVQIFLVRPKIELHFVPLQNILCQDKNLYLLKGNHLLVLPKMFGTSTICENQLLVWHKTFGLAWNILGLVEERGIIMIAHCTTYKKWLCVRDLDELRSGCKMSSLYGKKAVKVRKFRRLLCSTPLWPKFPNFVHIMIWPFWTRVHSRGPRKYIHWQWPKFPNFAQKL